jgi:hypothetical protein
MTAGPFNFTIEQGTDVTLPLAVTDPDGAAIDLTGCTAAMMIRRSYDATDTLVSLSDDDGITLGGADGTITIIVDSSVTNTMTAGTAVYDFKLFDSLGDPVRLIQGIITISPAVTR